MGKNDREHESFGNPCNKGTPMIGKGKKGGKGGSRRKLTIRSRVKGKKGVELAAKEERLWRREIKAHIDE